MAQILVKFVKGIPNFSNQRRGTAKKDEPDCVSLVISGSCVVKLSPVCDIYMYFNSCLQIPVQKIVFVFVLANPNIFVFVFALI